MSKIYPIDNLDTQSLDTTSSQEIYKQKYTQDRYALYLRRIIGHNAHDQEPLYNVNYYDEWIPIFGIFKIKSVAIAEKGDDAYLAIGEYWLMFFLLQFFCCLLFISGPDIDCKWILRSSVYFLGIFIYGIILFLIFLNLRVKSTQRFRILRIPFAFSIFYNTYLVFARCNAWNSLLISYFLFQVIIFLMMYSFLQQAWESNVQRRLMRAFMMSWTLSDLMGSVIFGEILILFYEERKIIGYFIMVCNIMGIVLLISETLFLDKYKKKLVNILVISLFIRLTVLFVLMFCLVNIQGFENNHFRFGLGFLFTCTGTVLVIINRICLTSSDQILESLQGTSNSEPG